MTILVTGRTFEHRDKLSNMGGWFNRAQKRWEFEYLTATDRQTLSKLVGCIVSETNEPTVSPDSTDDDGWLSGILARFSGGKREQNSKPSTMFGDDATWHNHFADQNPTAFFGFSTLGHFIDYIEGLPADQRTDDRRQGWANGNEPFHGSASMSEALDLARNGWQEGLTAALEVMERLALDNPRVKRRKPALAGGAVNVGRMLSGDPAHMICRPKQPGRKTVTFFVEAGCNAYISTESIIIRAAIIGAIVDMMENVGYSCSIVALDTSVHGRTAIYQIAVQLKECGERLNLADLMFTLGHPSFLRRMSFAAQCSTDVTRESWRGLGSASNAFDDEHPTGRSEFYVPVLETNIESVDDGLQYVIPKGLPLEIKRHG